MTTKMKQTNVLVGYIFIVKWYITALKCPFFKAYIKSNVIIGIHF